MYNTHGLLTWWIWYANRFFADWFVVKFTADNELSDPLMAGDLENMEMRRGMMSHLKWAIDLRLHGVARCMRRMLCLWLVRYVVNNKKNYMLPHGGSIWIDPYEVFAGVAVLDYLVYISILGKMVVNQNKVYADLSLQNNFCIFVALFSYHI